MPESPPSVFNTWEPRPSRLALQDDEIHIWRADLDCDGAALRQLESTLAADEKARARRFVFPHDRDSFIAARGILRDLLGAYLNRAPAEIKFEYGPQGKPALASEWAQTRVRFNISHSHGIALLAFAVGRDVGIDVELIRPDVAPKKIADRFFSAQEVEELRSLPPAAQDEGFFLCWTRKEAYIKARGEGLQIPLASFNVSLTPEEPERLQASDGALWTLRSLRPEERYVGALVGEGKGWNLSGWKWTGG